ncbi:hypothetical protein A6F65_00733 [Paraurantiacibacter namhicola]|uniref:Uncharacterized protein n=1 Tax=Paraurantiacibacter namhicola TaxID=645517 RepID=A0A1C7D6G7_9SPHN|nr:hypothetical protein A6F65_00733 [Paraurantiacibacter namhicola]
MGLAAAALLLCGCQGEDPTAKPAEQAFEEAMLAPLPDDAIPITSLFERPGRYIVESEIGEIRFEGMSAANRQVAEAYYAKLGRVPVEICLSEKDLSGDTAAVFQNLAGSECELRVHAMENGEGRSGSVCSGPLGDTFHIASPTNRPGEGEVTEIHAAGDGGYAVVQWNAAVRYMGPCGSEPG